MSKLDNLLVDFGTSDELFHSDGKVLEEYKKPFKELMLEVIGEDVEPNTVEGILRNVQLSQNALKKVQRQKVAEL